MTRRTVKAHSLAAPSAAERMYQRTAKDLDEVPEVLSARMQNAGVFLDLALSRIAWGVALDRPEAEQWSTARDALDLVRALFIGAVAPHRSAVTVRFRGAEVAMIGGSHSYVNGRNWLRGWALARALRDRDAMRELCELDASIADKGGTLEFMESIIKTLQAMEMGLPWEALHDLAVGATKGPRSDFARPWLDALDALDQTGRAGPDAKAFNDALEACLVAHRDVFGKEENSHITEGRIDWVSVGLANRALDEGLSIECDSEYIPSSLTRGMGAAPSWETLLKEPPPELAVEHVIGHPEAPDAPDGCRRLFMWVDGRVRVEHRVGKRARGWTARVDRALFTEVLSLSREADVLHHAEPTLPGGPSFRVLSLHHGGRHADALVARARESSEPWRALFTVFDSVVAALSGERPKGSLSTREIAAHELAKYKP